MLEKGFDLRQREAVEVGEDGTIIFGENDIEALKREKNRNMVANRKNGSGYVSGLERSETEIPMKKPRNPYPRNTSRSRGSDSTNSRRGIK